MGLGFIGFGGAFNLPGVGLRAGCKVGLGLSCAFADERFIHRVPWVWSILGCCGLRGPRVGFRLETFYPLRRSCLDQTFFVCPPRRPNQSKDCGTALLSPTDPETIPTPSYGVPSKCGATPPTPRRLSPNQSYDPPMPDHHPHKARDPRSPTPPPTPRP